MATTIRVDDELAEKLRVLSKEQHRPIGEVVHEAIERYRKDLFWAEANASMDRLRADPEAWAAYEAEIEFFQGSSMDGLESEAPYFTADELEEIRAAEGNAQRG